LTGQEVAMFQKERFIEECRAALKERNAQGAIRELMARAVSEPGAIVRELGEPRRAGLETLYRGEDLTVLNLLWGPRMVIRPHDHRVWAVIGIYGGREQNTFYRRSEDGLKQHGVRELDAKDVAPLGATIIHSVTNPLDQLTAAIHVYGGDFFNIPRSEWDPATFQERPYSSEETIRAFEESNKLLRSA
jgi:predicted metal-dependent enzyme (double-stranded beta helix superfamily)